MLLPEKVGAGETANTVVSAAPADDKLALIAAAQARAAAKKEAVAPQNTDQLTPIQQAEVDKAEARRALTEQLKDGA